MTIPRIKHVKEKTLVILMFLLAYLISFVTQTGCIWKKCFGVPCPGCGYTRALLAACRLDFGSAFSLNPMFWSFPVLAVYFVMDGNVFKNKMLNRAVIFTVLAGFLALGIYRLCTSIQTA